MSRPWPLAVLALLAPACAPAYLEPREAGPDFAVQGEYGAAEGGLAAQVVARGGGRFDVVFLSEGLPGEREGLPGEREELPGERAAGDAGARVAVSAQARDGELVFAGAYRGSLRGGELRGRRDDGRAFALRRVERQSPTLGAPPPPGATVLFAEGAGPGGFEGEVDARGLLAAGARSRARFRDFRLHLEFLLPFKPESAGQQRGNSGVYLQDRYEVQVLDSFGLPADADECGAIYAQRAPDRNMSLPPLRWQTYDIAFRAARFDAQGRRTAPAVVTVDHNGVRIHDAVELAGPTGQGDPEGPEPGPLYLQDHWNPVFYRNVWIVEE